MRLGAAVTDARAAAGLSSALSAYTHAARGAWREPLEVRRRTRVSRVFRLWHSGRASINDPLNAALRDHEPPPRASQRPDGRRSGACRPFSPLPSGGTKCLVPHPSWAALLS